jgi:hypothetical protein
MFVVSIQAVKPEAVPLEERELNKRVPKLFSELVEVMTTQPRHKHKGFGWVLYGSN